MFYIDITVTVATQELTTKVGRWNFLEGQIITQHSYITFEVV